MSRHRNVRKVAFSFCARACYAVFRYATVARVSGERVSIQHDWDSLESRRVAPVPPASLSWRQAHAQGAAPAMTLGKRLFDVSLAAVLLVPLSVVMAVVALLLLVRQGRPILYAAPRMRAPGEEFTQWKFRTMTCDAEDSGASGAHKDWRITGIGRVLRKTRIDELPQLFNILKGDMSFVGPRPPLREYVDRFPLEYARTLQCRPGVTGLATLIYHQYEDAIMASCDTAAATEAAYYRRCLPMKFRLEDIYLRNRSLGFDLWIIGQTVLTVITNLSTTDRHRARIARKVARRAARRQANGSGA